MQIFLYIVLFLLGMGFAYLYSYFKDGKNFNERFFNFIKKIYYKKGVDYLSHSILDHLEYFDFHPLEDKEWVYYLRSKDEIENFRDYLGDDIVSIFSQNLILKYYERYGSSFLTFTDFEGKRIEHLPDINLYNSTYYKVYIWLLYSLVKDLFINAKRIVIPFLEGLAIVIFSCIILYFVIISFWTVIKFAIVIILILLLLGCFMKQ